MRSWTKLTDRALNIDILLFDRFSNLCLANALEPLRAANTLAGREVYHWRISTLDGAPAVSSSGLQVLPHGALPDGPSAEPLGDYLFVISSYGQRALTTPATLAVLRRAAARTGAVVGMDTGAWLMAAAGLLEGRRATIHWDELDHFAERFLTLEAARERFVIDGDRITCGGATTAFDLVLDLIRDQQGEALRLDVAALFMHEPGRDGVGGDAGLSGGAPLNAGTRISARAVTLMQENLEQPLAIAAIARALGCSQKHLERRFHAEFAAPPARVYQHLRLTAARRLAETTALPVTEIALRCGYGNASAMTRAFAVKFGVTPSGVRGGGLPLRDQRSSPP